MKAWLVFSVATTLASTLALGGCILETTTSGYDSGVGTSRVCTPNTTQACDCVGAPGAGVQSCSWDGAGYGRCECPLPPRDAGFVSPMRDAGNTMPPPVDAGAVTPTVSVSIVDTTFAPFMAGGASWDLDYQAVRSSVEALSALVSRAGPYGAVLGQLAPIAAELGFNHFAQPEPTGTAEIFLQGRWQLTAVLATEDTKSQDTYFTTWPTSPHVQTGHPVSPGWIHVPLTPDVQVRLRLYDGDVGEPGGDDPAGNPVINYQNLMHALSTQQTVQVNVAAQTYNQVISVGISVTRE